MDPRRRKSVKTATASCRSINSAHGQMNGGRRKKTGREQDAFDKLTHTRMQAHIQKSSHISHLLISSMATGTHLVGQIETFCGPFFFLLFRCRNSLMANTQRKKKTGCIFFFLCYLTFPPTNLRRYLVPLEREKKLGHLFT